MIPYFSDTLYFPHLNIFDNVAFGLKLKKLPKAEIIKKVKKALEIVDLEGFETRTVQTLSGGQQQRVAIARALDQRAPAAAAGRAAGRAGFEAAQGYAAGAEKHSESDWALPSSIVTHDQEEALSMSDTIVVMAEGKIQHDRYAGGYLQRAPERLRG